MSPARAGSPGPEQAGYVQIGRGARLEGKLSGAGAAVIQGELVGEVELEGDLLVDAGGVLEGQPARASRLRIDGTATGSLRVRGPLEIGAGGVLEGRAQAQRLEISPDASIEAQLTIRR
jgi:cytoskeletal protein CcmA (bactofilin family)